ncbi:MAG: cysteine desulfurase family protein [Acidimicrobiia bacterium]
MHGDPSACLDHAASTPMRPEALAAMAPFLVESFGNPSGGHAGARAAKNALEEAREVVAAFLGARPGEVVITGGGTESDNLALLGAARAARSAGRGDGVVTTQFEHKGVLAPCDRLERDGFRVARVPVTPGGVVDLDALEAALDERTVVVSVMLVNNEVGTVQPLAEVAALVRARAPRAVIHTDAVQGVPWLDVSTETNPADLVSVSAHKFGGPKGTGALVVRGAVAIEPLIEGGGQERGLRAGTVNVAGAAAMAAALRVTHEQRAHEVAAAGRLRDRLIAGIADAVPDAFFNGDPMCKVAGNCHVGFPGVEAETLLVALDRGGVLAAAGSSCSSGATEPSHVLAAMGIARERALASIRLSLGFASTDADVDHALAVIPDAVEQLRQEGRRASTASELAGVANVPAGGADDEGLRRSSSQETKPAESTSVVVPGAERARPR